MNKNSDPSTPCTAIRDSAIPDAEWLRNAFAARLASEAIRPGGVVGTINWETFAAEVRAHFSVPESVKDHLIREAVNSVAEVARNFGNADQLRSRVHNILLPLLRGAAPQLYTCAGKGGSYHVLGVGKTAGKLREAGIGPIGAYVDAKTGEMYLRSEDDYKLRIVPATARSAAGEPK
jgi:hypothetical protein